MTGHFVWMWSSRIVGSSCLLSFLFFTTTGLAAQWSPFSDLNELRFVLRRATSFFLEVPESDVADVQPLLRSAFEDDLHLFPKDRPKTWVEQCSSHGAAGAEEKKLRKDENRLDEKEDRLRGGQKRPATFFSDTQRIGFGTAPHDSVLGLFCPLLAQARVSRSFLAALDEYDIGLEGELSRVLGAAEWAAGPSSTSARASSSSSSAVLHQQHPQQEDVEEDHLLASPAEWREILQQLLRGGGGGGGRGEHVTRGTGDSPITFWLLHPRHLPTLLFWFRAWLLYRAGTSPDREAELEEAVAVLTLARDQTNKRDAHGRVAAFTERVMAGRVCWGVPEDVVEDGGDGGKLVVLPLFRLLLGMTVMEEARRCFFEAKDMAVAWQALRSSPPETVVDVGKLTKLLAPHYGKHRIGSILEYLSDSWNMLLQADIAERVGKNSLPPHARLPHGIGVDDDSLYHISKDRRSEHMDDLHLSARLSSALRELQDDIFRLVFMVVRPQDEFTLIGQTVNMTSFGLAGIENSVSFPGNLLFPFSPAKEQRLLESGGAGGGAAAQILSGVGPNAGAAGIRTERTEKDELSTSLLRDERETGVREMLLRFGFSGIGGSGSTTPSEAVDRRMLRHRLDCGFPLALEEGSSSLFGNPVSEDSAGRTTTLSADDEEAAFFAEDGNGYLQSSQRSNTPSVQPPAKTQATATSKTSPSTSSTASAYFRDTSAILNERADFSHPTEQLLMRHEMRRFLWKGRHAYVRWHVLFVKMILLALGAFHFSIGVERILAVLERLWAASSRLEGSGETRNHNLREYTTTISVFAHYPPVLVLLSLGLNGLHLVGHGFELMEELGRRALSDENLGRHISFAEQKYLVYGRCLRNRVASIRLAASASSCTGTIGGASSSSDNACASTTRMANITPSNGVEQWSSTSSLWADNAQHLPLTYTTFSIDGLDAVIRAAFQRLGFFDRRDAGTPGVFFVDIGIGRPACDFQTRALQLLEDPNRFKGLKLDMVGSLNRINYQSERVSPENIVPLLRQKYRIPVRSPTLVDEEKNSSSDHIFGLFSLHIDSFDWHVMRSLLLGGYRPVLILIQTLNGYFYPERVRIPLDFTMVPRYRRTASPHEEDPGSANSALAALRDQHSRPYVAQHGHFKAYSASVKGLLHLARAFGYELVYIGFLSVMFVDRKFAGGFEHAGDLQKICEEYLKSPRGFSRTWPSSERYCSEPEVAGFSPEELQDLYYFGEEAETGALSPEKLRDGAVWF